MKLINEQSFQLELCHLKDAARYRALAGQNLENLPIRVWRDKLASLSQQQTAVYFIIRDGVDIGYALSLSPFDSLYWNLVYLSIQDQHQDREVVAREVAKLLFKRHDMLYRIDMYYFEQQNDGDASTSLADEVGREKGLFSLTADTSHLTFYAPELCNRQVSFMPWPFGYLAIMTNEARDKIESIEFVRGNTESLCDRVKMAAAFAGLIDSEGKVIEGKEIHSSIDEAEVLVKARDELAAYLETGSEPSVDYEFPEGTLFQQRVWEETAKIPFGSVKTYSDIALLIEPDQVKAGRLARAVGQALGANPLPIIIPCHRVIGANRDLTGFSGGVDIKEHLLQMEMWKIGDRENSVNRANEAGN